MEPALGASISGGALMHWMRMSGLIFVLAVAPQIVRAQAAAEQAGATNSSAGVAATTEKEIKPAGTGKDSGVRLVSPTMAQAAKTSEAPAASTHLVAHDGPPPEEVNRKALEENAGPDAGKLLLRSTPAGAQVFINGAYVGKAPMLLIVPPGKYKVEMRGGRMETGSQIVGLLANQTQQVAMTLRQLYPSSVSMK
jgi:hypothetical protein